VAAEAGLKPQLVHYYFVSMDDLFVSVIRRGAARSAELIEQARASPKPLWALWRLSNQPTVTILSAELNAAARHRSAIRKELAQAAEQFRLAQADTLAEVLQRYDADTGDLPVRVLLLFAEGLARGMGADHGIGVSTFHDDALAFVEGHLRRLEGEPPQRDREVVSTVRGRRAVTRKAPRQS
jgi:AcrR family transcriptional regulator